MKTVLKPHFSFLKLLMCTSALILFSSNNIAQAAEPMKLPLLPVKGWLLMDAETGSVLAEMNGRGPLEPASITKIMSSYLVAEAIQKNEISLVDKVIISEYARSQEGSRMFVEKNSSVSVLDLMKGMIIHSGNDATVALSEHVFGTEANFVVKMNAKAAAMGLKDTHFENSTGLPVSGHLTTAYDIAKLSRHLIYDHPNIYKMYSEKTFTWNKIKQDNRNRLLFSDQSVDGIKTGHTSSAGYCLVSSSIRNNFRLIAVVLGGQKEVDRYKASQDLLSFGYSTFTKSRIYNARQVIGQIPLLEGEKNMVPFGLAQNLNLAFAQDRYADITAVIEYKTLKAPIQKGDAIGEMVLSLDGAVLFSSPIVALESIETANFINMFLSRFKTRVVAKFNKLVS